MRCSMPPPRPRRGFPCRRALDLGAALLTVLLVAPTTTRAAMCPPPIFKTLDVQCRWVLGRPVPCDEPVSPGTTAIFTCKPQYRLPQSVQDAAPLRPGQEPPEARALGLESAVCHDDGSWSPLPSSCVPECGRVVGNGETLVVDGKPVNSPLEFPWHVAIYDRKHKKGITQVCGGTLITPKFFVSAAHCFAGPQLLASSEVQMRPPAEFAAAVGKINRDWAAAEDTVQKRDVKQIYVNGYGGRRLNHVRDLALVEVDAAVELHAYTMPACVDWGLQERPVRDGDVGSVVGWGGLFKRPVGEKLQMASLPFVNKTRCLQLVPAQMVQYILLNDDRFCAGLMNGTTVAHGDSGGGLTFPSRERKHFLQGVVSVGMPDARTLTAFTNVTPFVRWMADKIQDEEIRAAAAVALLPLEIPTEYTASDLEEEQRVAYFREDVGLNLHHLHWHSYYSYLGPRSAVAKDRRGELLYYMHAQLLARYNGERLSNSLPRVKHLSLREPVKEGYYPKLDNLVSSRVWPSRPPGTRLKDINRGGFKIDIEDLERWTARIYDAIAVGYIVNTTGDRLPLTEEGGADLLGNVIESSSLTPNRQLYGELMNQGHILISLAHDPENRFLESYGVMGDGAVAMRDPIFYRWHAHVWDLMRAYKDKLPGYEPTQLAFPGVRVLGVEVRTDGHDKANELHTYWQASDLELSRGLDFSPRRPIFARLTHLQHRPFAYHIRVESDAAAARDAYVRVFMAPTLDERGSTMQFNDQRHLMVEMDKFHVILEPGVNTLQRRSSASSVTIPFERTFRNLDANRPAGGRALDEFTFCGCGLPQHMLVPRGTEAGLPHQLFVMVTDYAQDRVDQVLEGTCLDAPSLCGVFAGRYPDRRPMGFPFDRRPAHDRVASLRDFLTANMFVQRVTVRFRDAVEALVRNTTRFGPTKGTVKVTHFDPSPASGSVKRDHLSVPPIDYA